MSSLLPNILIIPGACVPALGYQRIVDRLREEGLNARVFELPTANGAALGHAATMEEDVAFFSGVLTAMCSTGADVVVLAHSYAGCVASDAIHGLTEKAAGRGRVRGLIALTAALPKVGESMGGLLAHLSFDLFEPKVWNGQCHSVWSKIADHGKRATLSRTRTSASPLGFCTMICHLKRE